MTPQAYSYRSHDKRITLFDGCLFAAWLGLVIVTLVRHEFWRDEVRPLSFAMDSSSLSDLSRFMTHDGHPMLWHLLLYGSYQIASSRLVLPILSVLIAGAAVALFLFRSPFPAWVKALFVFCGLPLYEYSVMARNYGISMLLLFVFAWIYPRRHRYPVALGVALALLCNTNIHSLLLAGLLTCVLLWDTFVKDRRAALRVGVSTVYIATAIFLGGVAAALYTVWPAQEMIASDPTRYTVANTLRAIGRTMLVPAGEFNSLFPPFVPRLVASAILIGAIVGLIARPHLLVVASAGLLALSVFFSVVYGGSYRHEGLFVAFLVCLYWIMFDEAGPSFERQRFRRIFQAGAYCGLPLLFVSLILTGVTKIRLDWTHDASASRAFGDFLENRPEYADAILIGEPDFFLEAVPYYASNRIYIVREQRFGRTVRFVRSIQLRLAMGELLCAARKVQMQEKKPVLIVLGHLTVEPVPWESRTSARSVSYPYRRTFSWSAEEIADWKRHTKLQRQFAENVVGDEKYAVYSLSAPSNELAPAC